MTEKNCNSNDDTIAILTEKLNQIEKRFNFEISGIKSELLDLRNVQANNRQYSTNAATPIKIRLSETDSISPSTSNQVSNVFTMEGDHVVVYVRTKQPDINLIWFGPNNSLNISPPPDDVTACIEAVKIAHENGIKKLKINSDSNFVVYVMKEKNWEYGVVNNVANEENVPVLRQLICDMEMEWEYDVKVPAGIIGNEVDKPAQAVQANNRQYSTNAATPIKIRLSETDSISPSTSNQVSNVFTMEGDHVVVYVRTKQPGIDLIWFGPNNSLNRSPPPDDVTACIVAVKIAHENGIKKLKINSDSNFVVYVMKEKNWEYGVANNVENEKNVPVLAYAINQMEDVLWEYDGGPAGIIGNEGDKPAQAGAVLNK